MRFYFTHTTPTTFGGGPASAVASYLGNNVDTFGAGVEEIQVSLITLSNGFDGSVQQPEPRVLFRRKAKTIFIDWPCTHTTPVESQDYSLQNLTQKTFMKAVQDVHDALSWGLPKRIKKTDDFDTVACLKLIRSGMEINFPTEEAFREELYHRDEQYTKHLRTQSMHKKINIDWSQYHPDAAHLLHHPELWNETDPRMPHGNDFGKHILNNFDTFNDLPLSDVLKKLGLKPYETTSTSTHKNQALQAEVGLIFSYIKITGSSPSQMTDDLLDRMVIESSVERSFWIHQSRLGTGSHFDWMQFYLNDFANNPNRSMSFKLA
mgnify:CR=1 FL=1